MRLLLDTHFLIWLTTEPAKIRAGERAAMLEYRDHISISTISLWEVRIKWDTLDRNGLRRGTIDPANVVSFIAVSGFVLEPFTPDVATMPLAIPISHADPFDRILLVHAQQLGARLLTRDRRLAVHPLSLPL